MNKTSRISAGASVLFVLFSLSVLFPIAALAADADLAVNEVPVQVISASPDTTTSADETDTEDNGSSADASDSMTGGFAAASETILESSSISMGGITDAASGTDRRGGDYTLSGESQEALSPDPGAEDSNNQEAASSSPSASSGWGAALSDAGSAEDTSSKSVEAPVLSGVTETKDDLTVIIGGIKLVIPGAALAEITDLRVGLSMTESGRLIITLQADGQDITGFPGYTMTVYVPWNTDTYLDYYCLGADGTAASALDLVSGKLMFELSGAGTYTIVTPAAGGSVADTEDKKSAEEGVIKTAVLGAPLVGALGISVLRRRKDNQA